MLESNTPPQILHSDPSKNGLMVLNVVNIICSGKRENDPENLRFQWWIGGEGPWVSLSLCLPPKKVFRGRVSIPTDSNMKANH